MTWICADTDAMSYVCWHRPGTARSALTHVGEVSTSSKLLTALHSTASESCTALSGSRFDDTLITRIVANVNVSNVADCTASTRLRPQGRSGYPDSFLASPMLKDDARHMSFRESGSGA